MIVMWLGFFLAAYSVVGNDVIQTLGTFLTSNEKTLPWYVLWGFAATIMTAALVYGYLQHDIDYGRLDKFDISTIGYEWYYLLPPLVLLFITRFGIPVSTTFMILTLFSLSAIPSDLPSMMRSVVDTDQKLGGMIQKSLMGYVIAASSALVIFLAISRFSEKYFVNHQLRSKSTRQVVWTILQWASTGFLWFQWLTQDLANIYIYLQGGNDLSPWQFAGSVVILVGLLAYIFYSKGGKVQDVVRSKSNTSDIRSATIIDFIYGVILFIFKYNYLGLFEGKLPMSTTWVFIGLLAGREIGMRINLDGKIDRSTLKMVFSDLGKVIFGLVISVVLVFIIKLLAA